MLTLATLANDGVDVRAEPVTPRLWLVVAADGRYAAETWAADPHTGHVRLLQALTDMRNLLG